MTAEEIAAAVKMIRGVSQAANADAETLDRLGAALADLAGNDEREPVAIKAKTLGGEFVAVELAKGLGDATTAASASIIEQAAAIMAKYGAKA
jgi:hypothetical protein